MNKDITEKINSITEKITKEISPLKIILFGSYVWGTPHRDSDLDLFVIENSDLPKRQRQINLRRLFLDFSLPVDVLSFTPKDIDERKQKNDLFVIDILEKGKVLYERK